MNAYDCATFRLIARIAIFALTMLPAWTHAQSWPQPGKPIRIVVPAGPSSAPDIWSRRIAYKLGDALGVPTVVENRPGADGIIGAQEAARGAPDGHTLFMGGISTHVLNDLIDPNRLFRADRVLIPVTKIGGSPMILVASPTLGAKSLGSILERATAKPGALRYAYGGTVGRLVGEMIKANANVDMLGVPYKSQGQEIPHLLSGEIELSLTFLSVVLPQVQSGKLQPIAVASSRRHGGIPDLPTFKEAGLTQVEATGWIGIFVPAQTPESIVRTVHHEVARALQSPDMVTEFLRAGVTAGGESPEEFTAFIRAEVERFGRLIRERGIKFN